MHSQGSLLDVYARADITALCRSNAYNRLQWEDVTVGQALALGVRMSCRAPCIYHNRMILNIRILS